MNPTAAHSNSSEDRWAHEVENRERFQFGANWASFLRHLTPERIEAAEQSLKDFLGAATLEGKTFVDIGSGSGLFSLAARRLGAIVSSFDFDAQSVACTAELKRLYFDGDPQWTVRRGSILDHELLVSLGEFDIVYSWGVLHHTGAMWEALANAGKMVAPGGLLFIAIYDDRGRKSRFWKHFKHFYVKTPKHFKWVLFVPAFVKIWGPTLLKDTLKGAPLASWRAYAGRGMDAWHDLLDWLGGYPFEVARPDRIIDFYRERGFALKKVRTSPGGCNEFVFSRGS